MTVYNHKSAPEKDMSNDARWGRGRFGNEVFSPADSPARKETDEGEETL